MSHNAEKDDLAQHFKECDCHDSWDQCPCADAGHPADGSCDCCPRGTGLCGPRYEYGVQWDDGVIAYADREIAAYEQQFPTRPDHVNPVLVRREVQPWKQVIRPDQCHNGHPFVPGVSTDHAPGESDPRWCNTCGEARRLRPAGGES